MAPSTPALHIRASESRSVLIVEDDQDILESMASILEDSGYRVATCVNGRDALDRLQQCPVDAIVLDLMMPVMDGWEFVTAKVADPSIANVPVVAISADNSAKSTAIRADAYLAKPFDANELIAAVGRVLLEADRRKLAQRLDETERLALLGTIAAGVGHEISNPLSVVMANVEMTERMLSSVREEVRRASRAGQHDTIPGRIDGSLDRMQQQLLDCRGGLERIRLIVGDLRSVSRRAGDERTIVDLRLLIDSVILMASGEISAGIELIRAYEAEAHVVGNGTRLGQVFLNLLVNAAHAIPKDGAEQRIAVAVRKEAAWGIVEIRDTGRGMSSVQIERIFEPFFTTKGQLGGTGLGLAISKEIVEGHGGTIEVTSELGLGSSFTVRLPAAPSMADG